MRSRGEVEECELRGRRSKVLPTLLLLKNVVSHNDLHCFKYCLQRKTLWKGNAKFKQTDICAQWLINMRDFVNRPTNESPYHRKYPDPNNNGCHSSSLHKCARPSHHLRQTSHLARAFQSLIRRQEMWWMRQWMSGADDTRISDVHDRLNTARM